MPIGTLAGLKTAERKRLVIVTPIKAMEVNKINKICPSSPVPMLIIPSWSDPSEGQQPAQTGVLVAFRLSAEEKKKKMKIIFKTIPLGQDKQFCLDLPLQEDEIKLRVHSVEIDEGAGEGKGNNKNYWSCLREAWRKGQT